MPESIWFTDALMRIHVTPEDTNGDYTLIEALVPSGHMPPPHVHERDAESIFVLEGEITVYTSAGEAVLGPGQAGHVPAGEPHTVRATAAGSTRAIIISAPAGLATFLRAAGVPAEREELPVLDGPPDVARLMSAAEQAGMTLLGPPGTLPADVVAKAEGTIV
jgi:quercetin dioxygenase-like cupin family protein